MIHKITVLKNSISIIACFLFLASFHVCYAQRGIVHPIGGDILEANTICRVSWNTRNDTTSAKVIDLYLWDGLRCKWTIIAKKLYSNQSYYDWNIPSELIGDRFRIRIDLSSGITELTPTYFSIKDGRISNSVRESKISTLSPAFQIFPNPASSKLTLLWNGKAQYVEVRNLLGIMVLSKSLTYENSPCTFGTEILLNGTYLIQIKFQDGHEEEQTVLIQK